MIPCDVVNYTKNFLKQIKMWVKHHLMDFIHTDNDQVLNHHLNTILVFTNHTRFRTSQLSVVCKVIYI